MSEKNYGVCMAKRLKQNMAQKLIINKEDMQSMNNQACIAVSESLNPKPNVRVKCLLPCFRGLIWIPNFVGLHRIRKKSGRGLGGFSLQYSVVDS